MKKRLLSVLLCIAMLLPTAALPASAFSFEKAQTAITAVKKGGYPMSSVAAILSGIYQINKAVNSIIGIPLLTEEQMVITVDNTIQGIVNDIKEEKGVDFGEVIAMLPQLNRSAEIITSGLFVDIPVLQDMLKSVAQKLRAEDKTTLAALVGMFKVWLGIVDECQLQLDPVENQPGVYRFDALVTYRDGRQELCTTNILFNSNTNEITGVDDKPAILGFSMDLDQMYTYTGVNVWQRKFGFCMEYDLFCFLTPYIMNYVTQRIKFVYDNREWMCQIWKGTYFITNGGEVGFYTRPLGSIGTFYKCIDDEDMMEMSLDIYHKDELLFSREPVKHWWVTGFEVDNVCYAPITLTLVSTITMKDAEMLEAFTKALDKKALFLDYEVNGLKVTITW